MLGSDEAEARIGILRDFSRKKRSKIVRARAVPGVPQDAHRIRYFVAQLSAAGKSMPSIEAP